MPREVNALPCRDPCCRTMAEPGRGGGLHAVVTMRHRTAERRDHRAEHRSCSAIVAGAQNVAAMQDLVTVMLLSLFLFHCSRMVVMWQVWRGRRTKCGA